ncbi:MAG: energy transducer TonB, partial [Flavobacteriales bacterium]
DDIHFFAWEMPVFPGAESHLLAYLIAAIEYPYEEKQTKIQGTVYVGFVVEKDGTISNVKLQRGLAEAPGFGAAAVNAIRSLKKFDAPAKERDGRPSRLSMTIPVAVKK